MRLGAVALPGSFRDLELVRQSRVLSSHLVLSLSRHIGRKRAIRSCAPAGYFIRSCQIARRHQTVVRGDCPICLQMGSDPSSLCLIYEKER